MAKKKEQFYPEPVQLPKSKRDTGFKAAQLGSAIGVRIGGPYGLLIGTVAGFAVGLVIDEVLDD